MNTVTYAAETAVVSAPPSFAMRLRALSRRWASICKARRDFEGLRGASDHLLADIGLTRGELTDALSAPFWANPGDRLVRRGR